MFSSISDCSKSQSVGVELAGGEQDLAQACRDTDVDLARQAWGHGDVTGLCEGIELCGQLPEGCRLREELVVLPLRRVQMIDPFEVQLAGLLGGQHTNRDPERQAVRVAERHRHPGRRQVDRLAGVLLDDLALEQAGREPLRKLCLVGREQLGLAREEVLTRCRHRRGG